MRKRVVWKDFKFVEANQRADKISGWMSPCSNDVKQGTANLKVMKNY